MAVTADVYLQGMKNVSLGLVDWEDDTIKFAVITDSYSPDMDADEFWDDGPQANEAEGDDYPAGGWELDSCSVVVDTEDHEIQWDCANESDAGPTYPTGRYGVIYKDTGVAGTSPLLSIQDFGENKTISGVTIHADGLVKFSM